jgi:flagellar FliJ protein
MTFHATLCGDVPMRSPTALIRLKMVRIEQRQRMVAQIQRAIADFELQTTNLNLEIREVEERTKNHDPAHFAYSTFAKAAIQRRDNLERSADNLKIQLDAAKTALGDAKDELEAVTRMLEIDLIRDQSPIIPSKRGRPIANLVGAV